MKILLWKVLFTFQSILTHDCSVVGQIRLIQRQLISSEIQTAKKCVIPSVHCLKGFYVLDLVQLRLAYAKKEQSKNLVSNGGPPVSALFTSSKRLLSPVREKRSPAEEMVWFNTRLSSFIGSFYYCILVRY